MEAIFLTKKGIQQRMECSGNVAAQIEHAFVTVGQMLDAIEDDEPITDVKGVGPKTADVVMDWYDERFEREEKASPSSIERTSNTSFNIKFHASWQDALEEGHKA